MRISKLKIAAVVVTVAISVVTSQSAESHGGLSMEEDTCKLRVGRYFLHFVGYQPDSPRGPKEFCEDIPETGRTIIVLDYLSDELRDLPAEVRIVRDTGSMENLEALTVLHLPPKTYPSGSLNFELEFPEPGKFVGLVTIGNQDRAVSRFPFSVGQSRGWFYLVVPVLLVMTAAVGLYRFGMRRRHKATAALDALSR